MEAGRGTGSRFKLLNGAHTVAATAADNRDIIPDTINLALRAATAPSDGVPTYGNFSAATASRGPMSARSGEVLRSARSDACSASDWLSSAESPRELPEMRRPLPQSFRHGPNANDPRNMSMGVAPEKQRVFDRGRAPGDFDRFRSRAHEAVCSRENSAPADPSRASDGRGGLQLPGMTPRGFTPRGVSPRKESKYIETSSLADNVHNNTKVAAGKALRILGKLEDEGYCGVETTSVYGAAVALPQIARSAGWSGTLTALAIRSYFFLLLNIALQFFLLSMIGKEQNIMYHFAGQMHLCDFGRRIQDCPGGPNCRGPGGTNYTMSRLYGYNTWSTRVFIKQTLDALFPDRAADVNMKVDPGEFGLESYYCRMACIFIFMMAVVDDLNNTLQLAKTIYHVPTQAQPWMAYDEPDWADRFHVKMMQGSSEIDLVKFQVAGMSLYWKLVNSLCVLVPKVTIWLSLGCCGVHYLMETADIVGVIVNAMALTFVLEVDEMVFARCATAITKHIMANLEDMPLFNTLEEEVESHEEVIRRYENEELGHLRCRKLVSFLPRRLMAIVFWQFVFTNLYYYRYCDREEDGSWVSKDMFYPKDLTFNILRMMFGIENKEEESPFWTMPRAR